MEENIIRNPLGEERTGKLLSQFAVPSIIAMLVSSLYNIVDQFFIGRSVGELGNAATNISFPLSISCVAIALLFGIGGASAFNLAMGKGDRVKAVYYLGNAAVMMVLCGLVLGIVTELFLEPMLRFFGSPENVLGYAKEYTAMNSRALWGMGKYSFSRLLAVLEFAEASLLGSVWLLSALLQAK